MQRKSDPCLFLTRVRKKKATTIHIRQWMLLLPRPLHHEITLSTEHTAIPSSLGTVFLSKPTSHYVYTHAPRPSSTLFSKETWPPWRRRQQWQTTAACLRCRVPGQPSRGQAPWPALKGWINSPSPLPCLPSRLVLFAPPMNSMLWQLQSATAHPCSPQSSTSIG